MACCLLRSRWGRLYPVEDGRLVAVSLARIRTDARPAPTPPVYERVAPPAWSSHARSVPGIHPNAPLSHGLPRFAPPAVDALLIGWIPSVNGWGRETIAGDCLRAGLRFRAAGGVTCCTAGQGIPVDPSESPARLRPPKACRRRGSLCGWRPSSRAAQLRSECQGAGTAPSAGAGAPLDSSAPTTLTARPGGLSERAGGPHAQRGHPSDMQSCAGRRSEAGEVCKSGAWRVDDRSPVEVSEGLDPRVTSRGSLRVGRRPASGASKGPAAGEDRSNL